MDAWGSADVDVLRIGMPGPPLVDGSMATEDKELEEVDADAVPAVAAGVALGETGSPGLRGDTSSGFNEPFDALLLLLLGAKKGLLLNEGRRCAERSDSPPCEMLPSVRMRSSGPRESWKEAICVLMGSDMRLLK